MEIGRTGLISVDVHLSICIAVLVYTTVHEPAQTRCLNMAVQTVRPSTEGWTTRLRTALLSLSAVFSNLDLTLLNLFNLIKLNFHLRI